MSTFLAYKYIVNGVIVLRIKDDFVVKKICETTVVVPINSRLVEGYEPIVLNEDAGSIVENMIEEISFEELLAKVTAMYPEDNVDELREVLKSFIDDAVEKGYIRW